MANLLIPGTLYVPQSVEEVRDDILTDIRLETEKFDVSPVVTPGSDNWAWATGMGQCAMLQYAGIARLDTAITPLEATGDDLIRWKDALQLPDVPASGASGKMRVRVNGSATIPNGRQLRLRSRIRVEVVGTWVGVTDNDEIDIRTLDTGDDVNADADERLEFVNPPLNVERIAFVSRQTPLSGGRGEEDEARLRERILNRLGFIPGSGNAGHLRDIGFNASPAVQNVFVYPALGGPSSCKVVPVKRFDIDRGNFSRELSTGALDLIRQRIQSETPVGQDVYVSAAADENVDVAIKIEIPDSTLSGGNGSGWIDPTPWPPLDGGDTRVKVSVVTSTSQVTVDASTSTSPVAGQTHIMWWAPGDLQFRQFLVTAVSGSSGAWVLTLDKPMVDGDGTSVAVGDFISPAAASTISYGKTWVASMQELGPSENTTDTTDRRPRANRIPEIASSPKAGLSAVHLKQIIDAHPEITDIDFSYRSLNDPTTPTDVDDPPNVLVPQHFGIYKL